MPKVSVIIPIYNKGPRLKQSIESVLKQIYQDFELILINDGSIDETEQIMEFYKKKYPHKIRCFSQENKGVSYTRNYGIAVSMGEYVSFLDADDYYHEMFLQETIQFSSEKHCDVVLTKHYKNFLSNGKSVRSKMTPNSNDILRDFILSKIDVNTDSWLVRKNILIDHNISFREDITYGEDMLFFIEVLLYAKKAGCVLKELTSYNIGVEDSLSKNTFDKVYKDIEWIEEAIQIIDENCLIEKRKAILIDALEGYRLPAAVVYRLHLNKSQLDNYQEHKNNLMVYIKKFRFNNGLRSIKLYKNIQQL
ncbi:glycosyltransferase family 2 protein [Lysinibacillus sp. Ag94]|uniref:glycosyltransferase family 2 protein n=1 Tax=Lysinibacillus sp. Ag94 TaxID=2936682 RepID=UPI00200D95DB|nr:glycosyltransferase family 2 protein [Lysinibacillus sp. Ag94]UPW83706.1 glycosyltransferase [Lysinibacillus sp. Ag94]